MDWILTKEKLPELKSGEKWATAEQKVSDWVLVAGSLYADSPPAVVARLIKELNADGSTFAQFWEFAYDYGNEIEEPSKKKNLYISHWMPLPSAPAAPNMKGCA